MQDNQILKLYQFFMLNEAFVNKILYKIRDRES